MYNQLTLNKRSRPTVYHVMTLPKFYIHLHFKLEIVSSVIGGLRAERNNSFNCELLTTFYSSVRSPHETCTVGQGVGQTDRHVAPRGPALDIFTCTGCTAVPRVAALVHVNETSDVFTKQSWEVTKMSADVHLQLYSARPCNTGGNLITSLECLCNAKRIKLTPKWLGPRCAVGGF